MKIVLAPLALLLVGSLSETFAFVHQAATSHSGGTRSALSMADNNAKMPPSSELVGYYNTLARRNEQWAGMPPEAMVATELNTFWDPLGWSKTTSSGLFFMRESEIKHGRLAMLAAAGWPLAELWDRSLANALDVSPFVDATDRNPNILNGGLEKVNGWYWVMILGAASVIDIYQINRANSDDPDYFPGHLDFDPLNLYPKDKAGQLEMQAKEIRNGRLAMIAVTGFVVQEFVQGNGIVDHSSMFFKPFFM